MLATTHSVINGWDIVVALVVLLVAVLLEKLVPPLPWVAWFTLVAVVMFGLALTVKW